jgi:alpha-L-fucosidase
MKMNAFNRLKENYVPQKVPGLNDEQMEWFRRDKFGMFIHWGLYALLGRGEWVMFNERISVGEYAKLAERFDAQGYNPAQWARTAKAAGMRYMVLTTRHHDGFCLFDSKASSFTSVHSAARRDLVAEFVAACRAEGLKVGFYYSPMDWRFPGYFFPELYHENALEMKEQCWTQIRELMTNYGKIDILWYDGEWLAHGGISWGDHTWYRREDWTKTEYLNTSFFWESDKLNAMVRELQPDIIINNRSGWEGDFKVRERHIGSMRTDMMWEACDTIATSAWGWIPDIPLLTLRECITRLVSTVTRDGNYLLNVGPTAEGILEDRMKMRLKQIGEWLDQYGLSLYGTRGGPFLPGEWGGAVYRDNVVYLHILEWREDKLTLPALPVKLVAARGLNCKGVNVAEGDGTLEITIPIGQRDAFDSIVVLEFDQPIRWEGFKGVEENSHGLADGIK